MDKKTIIYISGEGRTGSTLLDIILGSRKHSFSAGELFFLPLKGIRNAEYCACGQPVPECNVWSGIIQEWNKNRVLDLEEYIQLQQQLISKKNMLSSYKLLKNPSGEVEIFLNDTKLLYDIIFKQTQATTIIDSSKAAGRISILRNLGYDVMVIHITRRFGDVLNSYKKEAKKDLEAGREYDIKARKTYRVIADSIVKNLSTTYLSKGLVYKKIKYEDIVTDPGLYIPELVPCDDEFNKILEERGPFYPEHLVAGNKIRMNDQLYIAEKPMHTSYHRLNGTNKLLAKCVDFFY